MILFLGVALLTAAFPLCFAGVARLRAQSATRAALSDIAAVRAGPAARVWPGQDHLGRAARRISPAGMIAKLDASLARSGSSRTAEEMLAWKAALGIAAGMLGLATATEGAGTGIFVLLTMVPVAFFAPDVLIARRAATRGERVRRALPDALDLMAILVEAGVGLEGAIMRAAEDHDGPLSDELRRLLSEMSLGSSRREALAAMRDRVSSEELSAIVLALLQADKHGVAIGSVLRTQAAEMRSKRRQRAKEKAAKTPVKILFPLVFAIFPALLAVILGPAVIRITQTMFSG